MTKAILLSIQPRHLRNILSGKKVFELRKRFPKDYIGWVYLYCTKANHIGFLSKQYPGKVVARAWIDNVIVAEDEIAMQAGLTKEEFDSYSNGSKVCALHIAKVEIFDIFKEVTEYAKRPPQSWCYIWNI